MWLLMLTLNIYNITTNITAMERSRNGYHEEHELNTNNSINNSNDSIRLIEREAANLRINNRYSRLARIRLLPCLDFSFKIILTGFMLTTTIVGCFLIYRMINGCGMMNDACTQCTNRLEGAEEVIGLGKQAAEMFIEAFKKCPDPKGREDLVKGILEFYYKCCNNNQ